MNVQITLNGQDLADLIVKGVITGAEARGLLGLATPVAPSVTPVEEHTHDHD